MNESTFIFRQISKTEAAILSDFFITRLKSSLGSIVHMDLWIKEGKVKEVFLVPSDLSELISSYSLIVYSAGISIGIIKDDIFHLEIEGAKYFDYLLTKKIHVKTQQFLYGRSIFVANVFDFTSPFKKGDIVSVYGNDGLHYGVGETLLSSNELNHAKPNDILIKGKKNTPFDRGWYLRKGG